MRIVMKHHESRPAAVVVEAAVILPILFLLTVGAIDLAQYINVGQQTVNASREASRLASRTETTSQNQIESMVSNFFQNAMNHVDIERINSAISVNIYRVVESGETTDFDLTPLGENGLANLESGSPLCVEVAFDYQSVRWISGPNYAAHTVRTICRRE